MRRTGLGRHGGLDDAAGDPLDGLVNLFDVGIVLAVAFLVAALGLSGDLDRAPHERERSPAALTRAPDARDTTPGPATTVPLPPPASDRPMTGHGEEVGAVYRLPDGRLVYVRRR